MTGIAQILPLFWTIVLLLNTASVHGRGPLPSRRNYHAFYDKRNEIPASGIFFKNATSFANTTSSTSSMLTASSTSVSSLTQTSTVLASTTQYSTALPTIWEGFYFAYGDVMINSIPPAEHAINYYNMYVGSGHDAAVTCHDYCFDNTHCVFFTFWIIQEITNYGCGIYNKTFSTTDLTIKDMFDAPVSEAVAWSRGINPLSVPSSYQTSERCGVQAWTLPNVTFKAANSLTTWTQETCKEFCISSSDCLTYAFNPAHGQCATYSSDVWSQLQRENYSDAVYYYDRDCVINTEVVPLSYGTTRLSNAQTQNLCGVKGTMLAGAEQYEISNPSIKYGQGSGICALKCATLELAWKWGTDSAASPCFCYSAPLSQLMVANENGTDLWYAAGCYNWGYMYTVLPGF